MEIATLLQNALLLAAGALAGFVDSIAGGGGLISLPAISVVLGPGAQAIGTNKIVASVGALVALIVYSRKGHLVITNGIYFSCCVGVGSLLGSRITPLLPKQAFTWVLLITCPLILWITWNKDLWMKQELKEIKAHPQSRKHLNRNNIQICLAGFVCGIYDGAWGPGAGTFMLLSLIFYARLPLFPALATSKLANTLSALVSLSSYATQNYVRWNIGLLVAAGVSVGALAGASLASKAATKIIRPVLIVVVTLLLVRLLYS